MISTDIQKVKLAEQGMSQTTVTLTPHEKNTVIETEYLTLSDLREIKRLVGSLSADEDALEQVWRIADAIQLRMGVFEELFGKVGIYDTDSEDGN